MLITVRIFVHQIAIATSCLGSPHPHSIIVLAYQCAMHLCPTPTIVIMSNSSLCAQKSLLRRIISTILLRHCPTAYITRALGHRHLHSASQYSAKITCKCSNNHVFEICDSRDPRYKCHPRNHGQKFHQSIQHPDSDVI